MSTTALALLLSQHAKEQAAIAHRPTITVTVSMSPDKPKPIKAKGMPLPIHKAQPTLANMPDKGSLDAAGFVQAMRNAGRRINDAGFPYTAALEVRGDLIRAIHAYYYEVRHGVKVHVGYDFRGEFGSQDVAARAQAMRDLKVRKVVAGKTREEERSAQRTLTGYVHGMPDHTARHIANLVAQEAREADTLIECVRKNDKDGVSIQEEKLSHIRADLTRLGHTA